MFEVCLFLVLCMLGLLHTIWSCITTFPKDYTRNMCDVCGVRTSGTLCSECCIWAKVQTTIREHLIEYGDPFEELNDTEHKNLVAWGNAVERLRLVKTAGW